MVDKDFNSFYIRTKRMIIAAAIKDFYFDYEDRVQDFYLSCFLKHQLHPNFYERPNSYYRKMFNHTSITQIKRMLVYNPEFKLTWGKQILDEGFEDAYNELEEFKEKIINNNNHDAYKYMSDDEIERKLDYNLVILYYSRQLNKGEVSNSKKMLYDILFEHKSTSAIIEEYKIYDVKWFQRKLYNDYAKPYMKIKKFMECVDNNKLTCFDSFTIALKQRKPFSEIAKMFNITKDSVGNKVLKYFRYMEC